MRRKGKSYQLSGGLSADRGVGSTLGFVWVSLRDGRPQCGRRAMRRTLCPSPPAEGPRSPSRGVSRRSRRFPGDEVLVVVLGFSGMLGGRGLKLVVHDAMGPLNHLEGPG